MKQFSTITSIAEAGLITSTVITGGISIAAFAAGVDVPVGITLVELVYFFSLQWSLHENFLKPLP